MKQPQDEAQEIAKLFAEYYEEGDDKATFLDLMVQMSVVLKGQTANPYLLTGCQFDRATLQDPLRSCSRALYQRNKARSRSRDLHAGGFEASEFP